MEGWIKLYRKFCEWEWYNISEMVHLFIHILLNANREPGEWRGIKIQRGQLITGRNTLSENTGISQQTIRTCLKRLKSTNEITIKSTNKYSIITVCNYESYQNGVNNYNHQNNQQDNQQLTSNQPTTNQQLTTNKKDNKEKNIRNIEDREREFRQLTFECDPLKYSQEMLDAFCNYWTEADTKRMKMRFENEKIFEIRKRLVTWHNNELKYKNNGSYRQHSGGDSKRVNALWDKKG